VDDKSLDVLGIKGLGDAIKLSVERFWDGAAAFLSRVCLPAAEELGKALRDRVATWRARNVAKVLDAANTLQLASSSPHDQLNPRLLHMAFEEASWVEDDDIHKMWAGLLVSGTSTDGRSDENLIFMNLLKQMSSLQVRIVNYAVENAGKRLTNFDLVIAEELLVSTASLTSIFAGADMHRIDRELDHLRELGLVAGVWGGGGINVNSDDTILTPTPLALNLFVRAQGSKLTPMAYWNLQQVAPSAPRAAEPRH